jgi:hypothetical protein
LTSEWVTDGAYGSPICCSPKKTEEVDRVDAGQTRANEAHIQQNFARRGKILIVTPPS